jgi:DNA polymerase-3 subunit gamma/tau
MTGSAELKTTPVVKPAQPLSEEVAILPDEAPTAKTDNKPITQEALTAAWNKFAEALKTEDARLFGILSSHTPGIKDETKIIFSIGNALQKEPLQKELSRLLQHLRNELENGKIEIEITLTEKNETGKAYSNEDKFAQMCRKNPSLMTFKQQLNLDFD